MWRFKFFWLKALVGIGGAQGKFLVWVWNPWQGTESNPHSHLEMLRVGSHLTCGHPPSNPGVNPLQLVYLKIQVSLAPTLAA